MDIMPNCCIAIVLNFIECDNDCVKYLSGTCTCKTCLEKSEYLDKEIGKCIRCSQLCLDGCFGPFQQNGCKECNIDMIGVVLAKGNCTCNASGGYYYYSITDSCRKSEYGIYMENVLNADLVSIMTVVKQYLTIILSYSSIVLSNILIRYLSAWFTKRFIRKKKTTKLEACSYPQDMRQGSEEKKQEAHIINKEHKTPESKMQITVENTSNIRKGSYTLGKGVENYKKKKKKRVKTIVQTDWDYESEIEEQFSLKYKEQG